MTAPAEVKGWKCGACRHVYPLTEQGHAQAAACCLCTTCHARPSAYTGLGTTCDICAATAELASAKQGLQEAQARLQRAEMTVQRLGVLPQAPAPALPLRTRRRGT